MVLSGTVLKDFWQKEASNQAAKQTDVLLHRDLEIGCFQNEPIMADDTGHINQSDQDLLERQFTTVFEHLINILRFELPFILVLPDSDDTVVGNKVVQIGDNKNVLSAVDFVSSEGAEEGLLYPMHIMVRDANGSVAYGYLDDIDAQPEVQIVHVTE